MTAHAAGIGNGVTPCGVSLDMVTIEPGIDCPDCLAILNDRPVPVRELLRHGEFLFAMGTILAVGIVMVAMIVASHA